MNAPNVPQAQPIDQFSHLCKFGYSKRANAPKILSGFRKVWFNISKSIAQTYAQSLMKSIRKNLKLTGDKGVFASFKN